MTAAATLRVWRWPDLSARFLALLEVADEPGAVGLVTGLLRDRAPAERVLLDVIAPAQATVGQLWAEDRWSVAREHAATAISERAVAAVAELLETRPYRGRITVACVDGEWHALPARILAEVLRLRGWRIDFLGASVPGRHLVTHLQQTDADTLALSCMLPTRLPRAHAAITAAQSAGVPVIAGGRGFGLDGRRAAMLGADAWASTAEAAADLLAAPDWPPERTQQPHPTPRGGGEYAQLQQRRTSLIAAAMRRLAEVFPPSASYHQEQPGSAEEDLAYILDFVAAALYVEDDTVFTDFTEWTAGVWAARGVPVAALIAGLDIYRDLLLPDCPQAGEILTAGKEAAR